MYQVTGESAKIDMNSSQTVIVRFMAITSASAADLTPTTAPFVTVPPTALLPTATQITIEIVPASKPTNAPLTIHVGATDARSSGRPTRTGSPYTYSNTGHEHAGSDCRYSRSVNTHANDVISDVNGDMRNGATFATGKVSQAFSLYGVNDCVAISNASSLQISTSILEAWIKTTDSEGDSQGIIVKRGDYAYSYRPVC